MTELDDRELLEEFARSESETAFAGLVARHVNLVYSAARRFSGNAHAAEEITQAVFIILARKAGKLSSRVVLSGWLYQTARLTAANFVKGEIRRQHREQEAYMQSTLNETDRAAWEQLAPLLEEAMGQLGETDRNAVVLRFFENKTAREVGATLRLNEAAAHKRVNRAVEKLRGFFTKRGVTLTAAVLTAAISANSVEAAPAGLAATVTAAAAKDAAVSGSTLTLIKGALKVMAWTKLKTAIVVGVGVLLAAGTTTVAVKEINTPVELKDWRQRFEAAYRLNDGESVKHVAPPFIKERAEYYRWDKGFSIQNKYHPEPPSSFTFEQQGQQLQYEGATFGGYQTPLKEVVRDLFNIGRQDLEGPEDLLSLVMDGDWTIRAGTTKATLLKEFEAIVQKETGRKIRVEPRRVERPVWIVSGSYSSDFRSKSPPQLDIYAEKKDEKNSPGLNRGDTQEFTKRIADFLYVRVVNEVSADSKPVQLNWRIHHDSEEWNMGTRRDEMRSEVMANVESQTGLSISEGSRPVEVWFVSEQK